MYQEWPIAHCTREISKPQSIAFFLTVKPLGIILVQLEGKLLDETSFAAFLSSILRKKESVLLISRRKTIAVNI
jgi:hypothetical protein